jgi:hypothetical protein
MSVAGVITLFVLELQRSLQDRHHCCKERFQSTAAGKNETGAKSKWLLFSFETLLV